MERNNKNNYTDLSACCKKKNGTIDWKNSIGAVIPFLYNGRESFFKIVEYIQKGSKVKIEFDNEIYCLPSVSIRTCSLGNLFYKKYLYEIGQIINNKRILQKIVFYENDAKHRCLGYKVECQICGNIYDIMECIILKSNGCRNCCNREENLICNARPDLKIYFQEKDIEYFYTKSIGSALELDFVCPICKNIKRMSISHLTKTFGCYYCSDKISSGEKFFKSILDQLGIYYIYQFKFDSYTYFNNKTYRPSYDFCFPELKLIVEIDGEQHYKNVEYFDSSQNEKDLIKDKFAFDNGYIVIRIMYISLEFDKLYNEIISKLSSYFNFKNINFEIAVDFSKKSFVKTCADLWNEGKGVMEICSCANLDKSTVRNYLKTSSQIGLSDYSISESRKRGGIVASKGRQKEIICLETNEIFDSSRVCSEKSTESFGCFISCSSISNNVQGFSKSAGGYHFEYYNKEEYKSA